MTTSIKLKKSSVSGKIPLTGDLDYGELAINYADGIIYYKNSSNEIKSFIDSDLINSTIDAKLAAAGVGDSAQILALIQNNSVDSSEVIDLVDSAYVQARQITYDTSDFTDSSFVTGLPVSTFTNDTNYLDSTTVTGVIDGTYITNLIDATYLDSAEAIAIVDSAYVQARQITYDTSDFTDSAFVSSSITTAINNLIDGAPSVLDTLNELAEAINDDSDFAGTITSSLALKFNTADFDSAFDSSFGTKTTTDLAEGSNLYFTELRAHDAIATYDSDINTTGSITATSFLGDGSGLTDVLAEKTVEEVKNTSGVTLLKGTPVYPTGVAGNAVTIAAADASDSAKMPAIGVLEQDLADDAEGLMIISGKIQGVNTTGYTAGDIAYVGVGGGWTDVPPTGESNIVQALGYFTRIDSNGGGVVELGDERTTPNIGNGKIFLGVDGGEADKVTLNTTIVPEGTNLYYTTTRFDSDFGDNTTDDLTEGSSNLYYTTSRSDSDFDVRLATKTTSDLLEGSNLYYTEARVDSDIYVIVDSAYVQARQLSDFASESYVQSYVDSNIDVAINNLIDGAPIALDTLNELAAAINDNENFASAITSQIDAKLNTSDFDSSFDLSFSLKTTDDLSEGVNNLYFSEERARASISADGNNGISYDSNTGIISLVGDIYNQSTFDSNYDIAFANSTTDGLSEGSTNLYYTSSRVDSDILSLVDSDYVNDRVGGESTSYIEYYYSADSGQTLFESVDDNGNTLTYTPGSGTIGVYLNGVLLDSDDDYSASSGSSIVLTLGADSGDVLQVQSFTSNLQIAEYNYTATAAQTEFTGLDNNSRALSYKVGYIEVYLNGVLLDPEVDYTATTGTSITLTSAAALNDFIQIIALPQFKNTVAEYADYYFSFVDSGGKTAISGNDSDGNLLQYRVGAIKVFNNGVLLSPDTDYNAVDGTTINFTTGLDSSDKVQIQAYNQSDDRPSYEDVKVTSGIYVGGTSNAYLMQQYLNGTFTPTIEGESSAGTASYTTQVGHFTRVGNVVNFTLNVSWHSHTGTGNLLVKGLPYTSQDTTGLNYVFPVSTNGQLTYTNYDTLVSKLNTNSDIITLHTEDGASNTAQLTVQSSGKILITGHYFIS